MSTGEAPDPLALGQRIVAILETGLRTATYKLATLTALIDHCVEHRPEHPDAALDVRAVNALRDTAGARHSGMPLELAMLRVPDDYRRTVRDVGLFLVQQPLHRLQRLPGSGPSPTFLYDDSWMHDQVSRRVVAAHGDAVRLYAGVAAGLARLSGLLKPTLEILWVEDVRRMNRFLDEKVPDVAGHLFGRERISLAPARTALKEAFGPTCFYCGAGLAAGNPVDHVLPWSRLGVDGLANLVLACGRCNGSKLQSLLAVELVDRALGRDRSVLEELAGSIHWPTQYDRVVAAARGIYRGEPAGSPTWASVGRTAFLDLTALPDWPA